MALLRISIRPTRTHEKVAAKRPKDWHRYLGPLMFAVRDTPQDSTGFTPFELLYGYKVHTPMTLMKRIWTSVADKRYRIAFCTANSSECDATAFLYRTNSDAK